MWFALLGPLAVTDGTGRGVVLAGPRQRVLLAALLLHPNVPVPAEALAEMVWDGSPPPAAVATLRSYVRRLRQTLGPEAAARVVARDPGYLIKVGHPELDVLEFEALCQDVRAALRAGQWAGASAAAVRASRLWRAAPLLDVPAQVLRDEFVPRLELLRLQVLEDRFEAGLQLGQHQELVPQLLDLTARHPLRERFHAQLMLALAGAGRQAEALDAYQKARLVLADELGTEPGPELRGLHQQLLAGDTAAAVPGPVSAGHAPAEQGPAGPVAAGLGPGAVAATALVVPRQLPGMAADFTGRAAELAALDSMLEQAGGQQPGTVVISAIGGTAGVGKTALAVRWAHQAARRFPGGQLYANLRGYDPAQPMAAAGVLGGFLRAFGVTGKDIPAEEEERAALYRSLLAGRRVLVVLDNARSVEQVRPLLPGGSACAVVVTSRDSLAGLVGRDGATRLDLDLLPSADAVRLLRTLIGRRAGADPDATARLAAQCCRLPLALRVAAELAIARPALSLADLTEELADQQRLDLLDAAGDPRTAVRAVFSWSYNSLDPGVARVFRLAGLHPGPDLEPYAAAALAGTTVDHARRVLGMLARANLICCAGPGRYSMHDLLRAYARELAAVQDGDDGQHAALTQLFDHYIQTAAAAMGAL